MDYEHDVEMIMSEAEDEVGKIMEKTDLPIRTVSKFTFASARNPVKVTRRPDAVNAWRIILERGENLCFIGEVNMMVEAGAVQVLGATLLPSNTQQPVRLWSPSWVPGCLSINASDEISDSCDGDRKIAAVIVLCSCVESPPAQNNAVSAFSVDQVTIPACKLVLNSSGVDCNPYPLLAPTEWFETLSFASDVHSKHGHVPSIMAIGPTESTNSLFSRFSINRLLQTFEKVVYLETNVGSGEFSPPDLLSLVVVSEPLFGPAHTHQTVPIRSYHFGFTSASADTNLYFELIRELVRLYRSSLAHLPLVVGVEACDLVARNVVLDSLVDICKPWHIVAFGEPGLNRVLPKTNYRPVYLHKLDSQDFSTRTFRISALTKRCLALSSYFGSCRRSMGGITLESMAADLRSHTTFRISFDDILLSFQHPVPPSSRLVALNASLVALCTRHSPAASVTSNDATEPTLDHCIGLGIVRSIDTNERVLYIMTPLSPSHLDRVNLIIRGSLQLPKQMLIAERFSAFGVPYTTLKEMHETILCSAEMKSMHTIRKTLAMARSRREEQISNE